MRIPVNMTINRETLRRFALDADVLRDGRSRVVERMMEERIKRIQKTKQTCPQCGARWDTKHNRCTAQCGESRET